MVRNGGNERGQEVQKRTNCVLVWKGSMRLKSRKNTDRKIRGHGERW